jgi:hypothetical protein
MPEKLIVCQPIFDDKLKLFAHDLLSQKKQRDNSRRRAGQLFFFNGYDVPSPNYAAASNSTAAM